MATSFTPTSPITQFGITFDFACSYHCCNLVDTTLHTRPNTPLGFTTTMSKSCCFAKSQAAFSARVFDSTYHS
ncbi:hypothetical protein M758_11G029800 [Ceratodon purpureus]|nr:hypothetical protein M758_11G029800 [Ceratodon purpureus]